MEIKTANEYRVWTVKTVVTEYSVMAADTENPLNQWEQDQVLLSENVLKETPISYERRNGGD
jgi:hypothetical protein|tara:strand:- start:3187 stop:3372 length:186 start_codon:yes stop_codon:yes gene_type:complete